MSARAPIKRKPNYSKLFSIKPYKCSNYYDFLKSEVKKECLRKKTLRTMKVGTKKETTCKQQLPLFSPLGEREFDLCL
jgi:hypothetical protein